MSPTEDDELNYYEILQCGPAATFDELKSNYKQLILQCHPDKQQRDGDVDPIAGGGGRASNDFVCINEAWTTLKDPVRRKHYDAELMQLRFRMHSNIFEHLTLGDMRRHVDGEGGVRDEGGDGDGGCGSAPSPYYTYNCRCGGQYIVDESEFNNRDEGADIVNATAAANVDGVHNENSDKNVDTGVSDDGDADDDDEVIVECSECSLVIVLRRDNGRNMSAAKR